jgi:hypothetical protein
MQKKKKDFWLATVKNPAVSPSDATGMQSLHGVGGLA